MKRVLLTGGLGFIGSHVVEHWLLNTDWEIVVLDSLRFAGRIERLVDIEGYDPSRVSVYWHDLRAPIHEQLRGAIGDVDYIVNMASDSHVDRSIEDPVPFIHNNIMLVLNILEYARQVEPEKIIQIGTDEVFGPAPPGVMWDERAALRPSNPYSASKASQEQIAFAYWRTYDVPVILTRTMNNFGERQHPEKFVPMAIGNVLAGRPTLIHGTKLLGNWVSGSRVWLHARNHADALMFILDEIDPVEFDALNDHPTWFNIAGEREVSNMEIVDRIGAILDIKPQWEMIDFHTSRPGHDLRYALDGSALVLAGWDPPMDFEDSFEKAVLWSRDNPEWLTLR